MFPTLFKICSWYNLPILINDVRRFICILYFTKFVNIMLGGWREIGWNITDLSTYLKQFQLDYTEATLVGEDYNWIDDFSHKINEDYYKCPLIRNNDLEGRLL